MRKIFYRVSSIVPDNIYLKLYFKIRTGKTLNLREPKTFSEKIQWLKLYWRNEICTICADKYKVREYVSDKIGDEILTRLYGVYDSVEEIDISSLPDQFVLKVNHGSGQNLICENKNNVYWGRELKKLSTYLETNHYYPGREWAYKNIEPKIICEEYLSENGHLPKDYKFYCFKGTPRFIHVDFDRFGDHTRNFYDTSWNQLDFELWKKKSNQKLKAPKNLDLMLKYASVLSKDIPFVRVDLYEVKNKVYFGEMTFYPGSGISRFNPEKYDLIFGEYIELPNKGGGRDKIRS